MEIMSDTDFAALLNIPDIKVTKTVIDSNGDFLIHAESTKNGTSCHGCGKEADKPYGYDRIRKIRHLPLSGRKCFIIIRFPRCLCDDCNKTTTQNVPWCRRNSAHTVDFEKHILLSLMNGTIEDVVMKQDIGYDAVEGIIERHIEGEVDWNSMKELGIIGIDEISLKKGHRDFVVIVTARIGDETRILAVLENKEKETVKRFFLSIPKRLRKTVRFVCSDMYDGFVNAAKEVFSKRVRIVIDRFHVAMLYRGNFEGIRKTEMKRLKKELMDCEYEKLKNVMWILRKKVTDLTPEETEVLKILFKHSPLLEMAYDLGIEDFSLHLERLKNENLDAIIHWGNDIEGAKILNQMRAMGMQQPYFACDRCLSDKFIQIAGENAEGVICTSPWNPNRKSIRLTKFRKAFNTRFGEEPETFAAHAYDGMNMLIWAVQVAGLNRAKIRDILAYRVKPWEGVTGDITLSSVLDDVGDGTREQLLVAVDQDLVGGVDLDGRRVVGSPGPHVGGPFAREIAQVYRGLGKPGCLRSR